MKIRIIRIPDQYKYGGELNTRKWKHDDGGFLNPYSAGALVDAIYTTSRGEESLGRPSHNYDFTQSEEWANAHGYYPDERGHRDDRVKKPAHPTHSSRGKWNSMEEFELTDKGMETPNYTLFGLVDGGQDPQAVMTYSGGVLLPEITSTPEGSYIMNPYDNIKIFDKGGPLFTQGGIWSNGMTYVNNGGTHEENPFEGVPMGIAPDGQPNLVEEGEVIFNDYVFSNRLFADGGLLESVNLPKVYDGYSFAAIAERLGKESKERPNDPISKRGLLSSMSRLQQAQETVRQQNQVGQEGVQYAHGGRMGTLFDGLGDTPNFLDGVDYGDWQDYGTLLEPINAEDLWNESMAGADEGDKGNNNSKLTWLRYAPVVGAAIGLGQNLFSKPDYTSADAILEAANQAGNYTPVGYTPIGNYLQYRPFDRNFYLNKLNAQAGATRRAIMNTTSPSRNAALLAADYNAQGRLGDLARQAEEYNLAQRQAVETFNRGTNMANAEMGLKAAMANQEAALKARSSRLSGVAQAMAVRDAVDARRGASMSANLTNFFNSLGDIGREEYSRNMIMSNPALYYSIDSKGNVTYKNGYESLSEAEKKEVRDAANKAKKKKAKGGYLTIKKK